MFGMPVLLSFAMGFILKPVDPAIAMTMMFQIQEQNKGVRKGVGFDLCCVWVRIYGVYCRMWCILHIV